MPVLKMPKKIKREEIRSTYRFQPEVKKAIEKTSEIANRSENLQAEYLIRLGLLVIAGEEPAKMTEQQIMESFNKIYGVAE